ncbi:MAG: response regulator [Thalassobaculum sp.]|jgi:two-component system chemotaxis response regulator CheY
MDDLYRDLDALVVEDDEIQRKITVQALKVLGFGSVRGAEDGETGLRACMDSLPDVIVCDIEMAPMDGMAFLRALRRTRMLKVREIPVVFLTSHNESETVREAVKAGVDAFIVKPPTLKSLKSRIDAVLATG